MSSPPCMVHLIFIRPLQHLHLHFTRDLANPTRALHPSRLVLHGPLDSKSSIAAIAEAGEDAPSQEPGPRPRPSRPTCRTSSSTLRSRQRATHRSCRSSRVSQLLNPHLYLSNIWSSNKSSYRPLRRKAKHPRRKDALTSI